MVGRSAEARRGPCKPGCARGTNSGRSGGKTPAPRPRLAERESRSSHTPCQLRAGGNLHAKIRPGTARGSARTLLGRSACMARPARLGLVVRCSLLVWRLAPGQPSLCRACSTNRRHCRQVCHHRGTEPHGGRVAARLTCARLRLCIRVPCASAAAAVRSPGDAPCVLIRSRRQRAPRTRSVRARTGTSTAAQRHTDIGELRVSPRAVRVCRVRALGASLRSPGKETDFGTLLDRARRRSHARLHAHPRSASLFSSGIACL